MPPNQRQQYDKKMVDKKMERGNLHPIFLSSIFLSSRLLVKDRTEPLLPKQATHAADRVASAVKAAGA